MFKKSIKYEVVIGIPDDEFKNGQFEKNADRIKESWKKYANAFYEEYDVYVSAIANFGHALYKDEWGCPENGERVMTFNCTANPVFIKDMKLYEKGVLCITKCIKAEYFQSTVTITRLQADICYLPDEDGDEVA